MNNKHNQHYGPTLPLSEELDIIKYRQTEKASTISVCA